MIRKQSERENVRISSAIGMFIFCRDICSHDGGSRYGI